ncbi:MAG: hypothetical protein LBK28_08185, partial [Propionibacteriaceae bacterium]|nr:hypothetical protein [Propionibacteriaceae bacterium]
MNPNEALNPELFADPPNSYRPVPFWGLNDELEDGELRRQIGEMADKGWGGFFTHARYGLETPYLAREYMDRMKTVVNEAKRRGLDAWIYDEHPFPAGTAGGLVTAPNPDFRHKALVMRLHNRLTEISPDESKGYYGITLDPDGVPCAARRVEDPKSDPSEHLFAHFYVWTEPLHQGHQPGFSNYDDNIIHGFASSDNLNPDSVRRFIEVTYGSFEKAVGNEFGQTLKGGFSDIPVYHWNYASPHPSIPWTHGFEDYFCRLNGYDLLPHLPSLFFDLGDYRKVRIDYWRTANRLFVESFTKQLYEWFDQRGLIYIAHYWGEETLHWQIPWTGDVMSHFIHHHYVGMDHSIRNIEDPLGIKQAATVAEQLGKPRVAAETYGMNGNSLTHAERKWMADWEYALGMNFLIPYVALYSFRGRRKRDEPSSIFIQQAYWPFERRLYDHCARLSYALTRGKRVVDILVLQPLSHAWAIYRPALDYPQAHRPDPLVFEGSSSALYEYNQRWMDLCAGLLRNHRDFHVGNEAVMEQFGRIDAGRLAVGEHSYRVVVVPSSMTWSRTTARLLRDFAAAGGTVIAVSPVADLLDGEPAGGPVLPESALVVADDPSSLQDAIDNALPKDIDLPDGSDILVAHRRDDAADIYFLTNASLSARHLNVPIRIPGAGQLELWDTLTGQRRALESRRRDGWLEFELDFYPVSSHLVVRTDRSAGQLETYRPLPVELRNRQALGGDWFIDCDTPNALVVDYAEVRIAQSAWTGKLPVWKAYRVLKQGALGERFAVRYRFAITGATGAIKLVIEASERAVALVNGHQLDLTSGEWWIDPAMRVFEAGQFLRPGENVIELRGRLGVEAGVENLVVLGDFSANPLGGLAIAPPVRKVRGRDVTKEGFPFFTGILTLSKTFTAETPAPGL